MPVTVDCCFPIVCSQVPECENSAKLELPWSAAQNEDPPPTGSVGSEAMS